MKRRALSLLLLLLSLFTVGIPSVVYGQACSTPAPTYTPTPGYRATVQAVSPGDLLVYFPLNETSGTVAEDDSGNNADGSYSGVTLNADVFLTGDPAPSLDGVNDFVNAYSASLAASFNGSTGTALLWMKVAGAGVWTDATIRRGMVLQATGSNRIIISRATANDTMNANRNASGTVSSVNHASFSSTDWFVVVITWDTGADQVKVFVNGLQTGATQTGLGVFVGALSSAATLLGAGTTAGANPWHGALAQAAVWDVALDPTQVAYLATIDPTQVIPPYPTLCPTYTPTPSPTWTPTPTPTFTFTPNIRAYLTVVPPGSSAPGQDVLILYQVTLGQAAIASLLFVIVVLYALAFARRLRRG